MFSQQLWNAIESIYESIIRHPFNRELAEGRLALGKFQFYLKQDALYLVDFSRALAIVASKSQTPEEVASFLSFADGAIIAERGLHQYYFESYGIQPEIAKAPSCFSYTNYLLATATHRTYGEAVAALLPCFWIYREVGQYIHKIASQNNPYQKWIDTYASHDFSVVVDRAIELTDKLAHKSSDQQRQMMQDAFVISARLEWMFWDSAYRLEFWGP